MKSTTQVTFFKTGLIETLPKITGGNTKWKNFYFRSVCIHDEVFEPNDLHFFPKSKYNYTSSQNIILYMPYNKVDWIYRFVIILETKI